MNTLFEFKIGGIAEFMIALKRQFSIHRIRWYNLDINENKFVLSFYLGTFSLLQVRGGFTDSENEVVFEGNLFPNYFRISIPFFVMFVTWLLDIFRSQLGWFEWLLIISSSTAIVLLSLILANNKITSLLNILEVAVKDSFNQP